MWKDHSSHAEAEMISHHVHEIGLPYLSASGGRYSSEWFWAKLLKCARSSPEIMSAAESWLELQDFIPAILTGVDNPRLAVRGSCAAGHKGMYSDEWGGWPAAEFLSDLHPELARVRSTLADRLIDSDRPAGALTQPWAENLGLAPGIPVATGSLDAHAAALAAGARPGTLVRILGTSACDITVTERPTSEIDTIGLCGAARSSVLPDFTGIEAGQAAVGDLFDWGARILNAGTADRDTAISELMKELDRWRPGETGLLALDWNNGNRSPLMDSRLSGLILGLTLTTPPAAIFRAVVEATGFGFRKIVETIESRIGQHIHEIVFTGGIAERNIGLIQLYADLLQRPIRISPLQDASAVGAACYAAASTSLFGTARKIAEITAGEQAVSVQPDQQYRDTYEGLYALYGTLHAAFSLNSFKPDAIGRLMKDLMDLRDGILSEKFETQTLVNV
jgi:L-ribulokinase